MNWRKMSHQQLSMIASHLAGGGTFCDRPRCEPAGPQALATLLPGRPSGRGRHRLRDALGDYAYEEWGCQMPERASWYLSKFLSQI